MTPARETAAPAEEPLGLLVARVAKALGREFDAALAAEGGSMPTWLILLSLKTGRPETQRELARAVGLEAPTVTHHLAALERAGLLERTRDGRTARVQLTAAGEQAFERMRAAAMRHDARLRARLAQDELAALRAALAKLHPEDAVADVGERRVRGG